MTNPSPDPGAVSEERVLAALERFRPRLRSLLFHYRIPSADGEDVTQEIAIVALRFAGESRDLDSWLVGVAHNRCRLYWRKAARREEPGLDSAPEPILDPDEEHRVRCIDFERGLAELPPRHGRVLRLVAAGYRRQEAAAIVGYSSTGIRKMVERSLQRLAAGARTGRFPRTLPPG